MTETCLGRGPTRVQSSVGPTLGPTHPRLVDARSPHKTDPLLPDPRRGAGGLSLSVTVHQVRSGLPLLTSGL